MQANYRVIRAICDITTSTAGEGRGLGGFM